MQELIKGVVGLGKPAQEVALHSTCFALSLFGRVDKSTCPLLTFSCDYLLSLPAQDSPAHFFFFSYYLSLFPHPCLVVEILLSCAAWLPHPINPSEQRGSARAHSYVSM